MSHYKTHHREDATHRTHDVPKEDTP